MSLAGFANCTPEFVGSELTKALRTLAVNGNEKAVAQRVTRWLFATVAGYTPKPGRKSRAYSEEQYRRVGAAFDDLLKAIHGNGGSADDA